MYKLRALATLVAVLALGSCSGAEPSLTASDLTAAVAPTSTVDSSTTEPGTTSSAAQRCVRPAVGSAEPTDVTIWHVLDGEQANNTFSQLVTRFNEEHPGIRVTTLKFDGQYALFKQLQAVPRNEWPDVVLTASSSLRQLADSKAIITPGECFPGDTIARNLLPVVAATYSMGGELQALPYGVSTPVLIFDATEMRAAGLDPTNPPRTAYELIAASMQIVASGASPHGLVVHEALASFLINQWAAKRDELVATPNNGRDGEAITVDFDTPENRTAMQWIADVMSTGGGVAVLGNSSSFDDLVRIVDPVDGATMSIHTSAALGDVFSYIDNGAFPGLVVGVAPMPGPGVGATVGGNAMWLLDNGSPTRAGAAWEAIRWLTSPSPLATFDAATGYIPPGEAVAADPAVVAAWGRHPQLRVGYDQLLHMAGSAATAGALYGPGGDVDQVLRDLLRSIVERHTPPAKALALASQGVNDLLVQYDLVVGRG